MKITLNFMQQSNINKYQIWKQKLIENKIDKDAFCLLWRFVGITFVLDSYSRSPIDRMIYVWNIQYIYLLKKKFANLKNIVIIFPTIVVTSVLHFCFKRRINFPKLHCVWHNPLNGFLKKSIWGEEVVIFNEILKTAVRVIPSISGRVNEGTLSPLQIEGFFISLHLNAESLKTNSWLEYDLSGTVMLF